MAAPFIAVIRYASGPRAAVNWTSGPRKSGRSALTDVWASVGRIVSARAVPEQALARADRRQIRSEAGAVHAEFERIVQKLAGDEGSAETEVLVRLDAGVFGLRIEDAGLDENQDLGLLSLGLRRAKEEAE